LTSAVVASDAPSASFRSTINSSRPEAGKNCCGTKRNSITDAMNSPTVSTITVLRRHAPLHQTPHALVERRAVRIGLPVSCAMFGRMNLRQVRQEFFPRYGTNTTAATHEASNAMVTTWKIERVYSPVLDCAVAIGRKPAAVISVPVSIGNAVLVQASWRP
jgi:hypothetical protein